MGKEKTLEIRYSLVARRELAHIWDYNAETRGVGQANAYEDFLLSHIERLPLEPRRGREVDEFPELRSLTLLKRAGGDGHVVIYQVDEAGGYVDVLHVYHTKQDIQNRLRKERNPD